MDNEMADKVMPHIEGMRGHFSSGSGAYYAQAIFFLAPVRQMGESNIVMLIECFGVI